MSENLVDAAAVAKRLGVCEGHVRKMARDRTISCHRLGKKCIRFEMSKVERELGLVTAEGGSK